MIDPKLAASIAFIAFGVNLFGAVLLLLLNAGSRSVRWYLPFHFCILVWLFTQGGGELWPDPRWLPWYAFVVAMLPFMFLLFAYMDGGPRRPAWHAYAILLMAALLLPTVMAGTFLPGQSDSTYIIAKFWMMIGWIGASALLWWHGRRQARHASAHPNMRKKLVLLALVLVAPISVISAILLDSAWFIMYAMPLITCWIMVLIFYGITRMQFYDIEVRVRRSGDIATETLETERLAVLGELTATIAHEVRNPLTGVRSLAQRIATEDIAPAKRQQYAQVILEETSRVEKLVSNLLDLSRRNARTRITNATTSLDSLFADLTLLVASRAERKSVSIIADSGNVTVGAPRELLAQALLNLLLNAVAHAPDGSTVDLTARQNGAGAVITVRDRGPGIPAAERDRIFEPFYTTRSGGTGLGLSVVRSLVREHGWQIAVDDAPGGGTQFRLELA